MELYLLRHGQAADADAWRGHDFDRPLTDEGRERMAREAKAIKSLIPGLARIVTSPILRACQTAEIVADALKMRDRLVEDDRVVNLDLDRLASILSAYGPVDTLMLVGHEPSMSATAGRLIGSAAIELKKGGLVRVDLPDPAKLHGTLVWLVPPKVLL